MAHTPGPWKAQGETWGSVFQASSPHHGVAYDIYQVDDQHLIAAAPDLLAALKRLSDLTDLPTVHDVREAWDMAHAAIKKAEGE